MGEQWKDVPGYEGLYKVSDQGRVYSTYSRRCLTPTQSGAGYRKIGLSRLGETSQRHIHRLVAEAFLANPKNLPQVNHKNGDKTDNFVGNLEWCTAHENNLHSRQVLKHWQGPPKRAVVCIETGKEYETAASAAEAIGVSRCAIQSVCVGRNKTAKNLHFKFKEEQTHGN